MEMKYERLRNMDMHHTIMEEIIYLYKKVGIP